VLRPKPSWLQRPAANTTNEAVGHQQGASSFPRLPHVPYRLRILLAGDWFVLVTRDQRETLSSNSLQCGGDKGTLYLSYSLMVFASRNFSFLPARAQRSPLALP